MKELFARSARYNTWMNSRLYELLAGIPDGERKADRGAFFHSIHGILNHLLLADSLWLGRFTGAPFAAKSLDQELYSDFESLREQRSKIDLGIEKWVANVTPEALHSTLRFTSMDGKTEMTVPLWELAHHMFNHQTHHRGQLTTLLDQMGYDYGVTDLPRLPDPI